MSTESSTVEAIIEPDAVKPESAETAISPLSEERNNTRQTAMDAKQRAREIQELIEKIDLLPDARARELLQECLQATLALYGDGLTRILELARNAGTGGQQVTDVLIDDELVRCLLFIHNLHPQSLETRLLGALDKVRPYLNSHGGNVELISLARGMARLRLEGTCKSCPSSSVTLELAVREAIEDACPDLQDFEVEGVTPANGTTIPHGPNTPQWTIIEGFEPINAGKMRSLEVDGARVLFCNVNGILYAYRNRCAVCAARLDTGTLMGNVLDCPSGHRFDVQHAGASLTGGEIHLDPFPLLAINGIVKIAVKPEPKQNQQKLSPED